MPDHNGPCRFGQYNRLQRIIFDRLGFGEPRSFPEQRELLRAFGRPRHPVPSRRLAGHRGLDILRKLLQERRPYEAVTARQRGLPAAPRCRGTAPRAAPRAWRRPPASVRDFEAISPREGPRKPVIGVVGEIFMRDNPFCSASLVHRLEDLGAETVMAPIREWIAYSSYRYRRDSRWKRDVGGLFPGEGSGDPPGPSRRSPRDRGRPGRGRGDRHAHRRNAGPLRTLCAPRL